MTDTDDFGSHYYFEDENGLDLGFQELSADYQLEFETNERLERKMIIETTEFELDKNFYEVTIKYESEDWFNPTPGRTGGFSCYATNTASRRRNLLATEAF